MYNNLFRQNPQLEELLREILFHVEQNKRPAEEVVLDDLALQKLLCVSKRKTAELRENRKIKFSKPDGKVYYFLADVLNYLKKNQVTTIDEKIRIK